MADAGLVLGTAGHIDHGKTALVRALTGVDTDRLPQERERGISIELGYAPLTLPSGRRLSVVDVPGHERFVRTMVAGATGVDLFLLVVAADDGVMPQTREHVAVLRALEVRDGVVAITKADLPGADVARVRGEVAELLGDGDGDGAAGIEVVACSARTGAGVAEVAAALDRVAARVGGRGGAQDAAVLHVDRAFTIRGAGTVVTGTLWSGTIARGDELQVLRAGEPLRARVRGVQVHDAPVERAEPGRRVAVNLTGVAVRDVARGDVLAAPDAPLAPSYVLDARLTLRDAADGQRVQVHHGTREAPGRLADRGDGVWQLRLEQPLLARAGDHVVVRSIAPPDTLGGGTITDPHARKARRAPEPTPAVGELHVEPPEPAPDLPPAALALEERLRDAGHEPPLESELGDAARHLPALRRAGRATRLGKQMWAHPDALADVRARVVELAERDGSVTLAGLRDALGTSRKFAQAHLERLDAERVTLRHPDDSRTLRRRRASDAAKG